MEHMDKSCCSPIMENFELNFVFFASIYFLPYIAILRYLEDNGLEKSSMGIVAAGAVAGVVSWMMTNPIDVIKTRYQNDHTQPNPIAALRDIYAKEGAQCFTRGILVNSLRGIPQSGVLFLGYEYSMVMLNKV